jgi:hypothetical protein
MHRVQREWEDAKESRGEARCVDAVSTGGARGVELRRVHFAKRSSRYEVRCVRRDPSDSPRI